MNQSVLLTTGQLYRRAVSGFDYPSTQVGQTAHVSVLAANALGPSGVQLAQRVLQGVEQDYLRLQSLFGAIQTPAMTVIVAPLSAGHDGSGGAYHHACSDPVFYCDADLTPGGEATTLALFVAEAVEVFEAIQGLGWDCGASNGEGLSRVLAEALHPGVLDGYETASVWLDGSRTDWVDITNPTDRSADRMAALSSSSTGCKQSSIMAGPRSLGPERPRWRALIRSFREKQRHGLILVPPSTLAGRRARPAE